MKVAVYPGSFDPITNGHIDILKRACRVFDEVILLLAVNPDKTSHFSVSERLRFMQASIEGIPGAKVDFTDGLTVDYCKKIGAGAIVRGLRAVSDFEYEFALYSANHFAGKEIDTVCFMSESSKSFISSSAVHQMGLSGVDISPLVPPIVAEAYRK
ncbi:MAG: pantetheine-phosphate adenylyltransferase [Candidatus Enteromonas sp.]|nr:pantetheine-phosphate adenylyltransferase [Candidatus Enteromonas sp.]MDY6094121.1 pantetheine-phosphate adenylyltransferase [Candidatus Enteromonas sp.]